MPKLTKIYTRTGDDGTTALGTRSRVSKDAVRVRAFGDIDELKSDLIKASGAKGLLTREKKKRNYVNNLMFSIIGSAMIIGLFIFINYYYSPNAIWFVYPTFLVLWWPLSLVFAWLNNRKK